MALKLLEGGRESSFFAEEPPRIDLNVSPLRPGLAHEHLLLSLGSQDSEEVERAAFKDGIPPGLWAAVAIESERALRSVTSASGITRERLVDHLREASLSKGPGVERVRQHGRRLTAFARELRRGSAAIPSQAASSLEVPVAYHTLVAWDLEAGAAGVSTAAWAACLLRGVPVGRTLWEASAAEAGQTLSEWIAIQAARLASC
jgi:hypothetical protein